MTIMTCDNEAFATATQQEGERGSSLETHFGASPSSSEEEKRRIVRRLAAVSTPLSLLSCRASRRRNIDVTAYRISLRFLLFLSLSLFLPSLSLLALFLSFRIHPRTNTMMRKHFSGFLGGFDHLAALFSLFNAKLLSKNRCCEIRDFGG